MQPVVLKDIIKAYRVDSVEVTALSPSAADILKSTDAVRNPDDRETMIFVRRQFDRRSPFQMRLGRARRAISEAARHHGDGMRIDCVADSSRPFE
jgi:hypothetical protein